MNNFLVALAILAQTIDAAQTCSIINRGGIERNPLLPQSCKGIILIKSGAMIPLTFLRGKGQRIWAVSMIGSGSVGIILTWKMK